MLRDQHILIVSQTKADRLLLSSLAARGFSATIVKGPERVGDELFSSCFDLLVIDLTTIDEGIEIIKRFRSIATLGNVPILVFGEWGTGLPLLAMSLGADAYEAAPMNPAGLIESVERLLNRRFAVVGAGE